MRNTIIAIIALTGFFPMVSVGAEEYVQTDRYTFAKVEAQGDQKAPLTTVMTLSFGVDVYTIGDAINEALKGSGYHWEFHTDDPTLVALPLPAVERTLGPIRLKDALSTIAGQAWILRVDELHRVIWFDIDTASKFSSRQ